jgi:hypothetical protein
VLTASSLIAHYGAQRAKVPKIVGTVGLKKTMRRSQKEPTSSTPRRASTAVHVEGGGAEERSGVTADSGLVGSPRSCRITLEPIRARVIVEDAGESSGSP